MTYGLENFFIFRKFSDFYCITPQTWWVGARGHNSPGAELLRGQKSQKCH